MPISRTRLPAELAADTARHTADTRKPGRGAHPGTPSDQVRVGQNVRSNSRGGLPLRPGRPPYPEAGIGQWSREKYQNLTESNQVNPWYWEYLYREYSAFDP